MHDGAEAMRLTQNLQSPIFRLPTEITLTIFELVIYESVGSDGLWHVPKPQNTPVALSSICSLFRQQVLGAPSLWRVVRFQIQWNGTLETPFDQLSGYLERSQEATIDVLFDIASYHRAITKDQIESRRAWTLVIAHLHRCSCLSVHAPGSLHWLFPIPSRLSSLQNLDVSIRRRKGSRVQSTSLMTDEAECQLRSLSVGKYRGNYCPVAFVGINGASIRTLTLQLPHAHGAFIELINRCPSLQSLSLSVEVDPSSDLNIPTLTSLVLNGSNCINWLTRLSAPCLEHLDFATWVHGISMEDSTTRTLISLPPKFPFLRTFFLDSFPSDLPGLRIAGLLHSLRHLVAVCIPSGAQLTAVLSSMLHHPSPSFSALRLINTFNLDEENIDMVSQLVERLPQLSVECSEWPEALSKPFPDRVMTLDPGVPFRTLAERFAD